MTVFQTIFLCYAVVGVLIAVMVRNVGAATGWRNVFACTGVGLVWFFVLVIAIFRVEWTIPPRAIPSCTRCAGSGFEEGSNDRCKLCNGSGDDANPSPYVDDHGSDPVTGL